MIRLSHLLSRLLAHHSRRIEAKATRIIDLGRVSGPIYAIGDVHGCSDLLSKALAAVNNDAQIVGADPTVILLGDLVDRGPDSATVLDTVLAPPNGCTLLGVLGNHERMMISFLVDPVRNWDWLYQGGYETLHSYGLSLAPTKSLASRRLHQMLNAHIPEAHINLLNNLPHAYVATVDNSRYLFCHGGLDAHEPLDRQTESAMLWGQTASSFYPGFCVVQGHIPVASPLLTEGNIRIDTGAYTTGLLTVLRICSGHPTSVMAANTKAH